MTYFKRLAKILEHPDAPSELLLCLIYLLSLDISDWSPQDIPSTRMKTEIIRE